jgi:hypothetical protein
MFLFRFHELLIHSLRFNRSPDDDFVFPRTFKSTTRKKNFKNWIGTWKGPSQEQIPFVIYRMHTIVCICVAVALELVPWVQTVAVAFLPIVPWHEDASAIAKVYFSRIYTGRLF